MLMPAARTQNADLFSAAGALKRRKSRLVSAGLFARRWTQGLRPVRRRALARSGEDEIVHAQLMRRNPCERDLIVADVDYGIAIDRVNIQVAAMELDAIEFDLVGARPEVGNCCVGRPRLAEDEFIGAVSASHRLLTGAGDEDVAFRTASERIGPGRADDELGRIGILRRYAASGPAVPVVIHKHVVLDVLGIGVALDDVGQRRVLDLSERLRVKTLVLKPQPVPVAQVLELRSNDGSERLSHHGSGEMVLGEAAGPQVDVIDAAISLLERLQRSRVARDLLEAGIRLKAERLARLVERAEAEIVAALDIDRRQVLPVRGVEQEVAQAVNDARVQCLRRVGSEMAQESVGAAVRGEIRRR